MLRRVLNLKIDVIKILWIVILVLSLVGFGMPLGSAAKLSYPAFTPQNLFDDAEPLDLSILGQPLATKEQCVRHLLRHNSFPMITVTPKELVDYFYEEGNIEGIRPDVAFAQALHETGYFRYGGDVVPLQNNYSGLGTIGGGVKGAWFPSAQVGVRAQIQHLLAYVATRPPQLAIADPRYELVKKSSNFGKAITWTDLNGKWAVPGKTYGQMILTIHQKILREK